MNKTHGDLQFDENHLKRCPACRRKAQKRAGEANETMNSNKVPSGRYGAGKPRRGEPQTLDHNIDYGQNPSFGGGPASDDDESDLGNMMKDIDERLNKNGSPQNDKNDQRRSRASKTDDEAENPVRRS